MRVSRVSWGDLSRDRYIACTKLASPTENTFAEGSCSLEPITSLAWPRVDLDRPLWRIGHFKDYAMYYVY